MYHKKSIEFFLERQQLPKEKLDLINNRLAAVAEEHGDTFPAGELQGIMGDPVLTQSYNDAFNTDSTIREAGF